MKQMILEIDEGTEFDVMEPDLQAAILKLNISWPESCLIGTSAVAGKKLILILCAADGATLTDLMNNEEFDEEGRQIKFNLGWSVIAEEGITVNQSLLLPYFDEAPAFDENGDQVGSEPITDLTGKLQTWAGRKWKY